MAPIFPGRSVSENTYTTVCVSHLAIRSLKSLPASQGFANQKGCSSQNQIHTPCMMYQSMQVSSLDRTSNILHAPMPIPHLAAGRTRTILRRNYYTCNTNTQLLVRAVIPKLHRLECTRGLLSRRDIERTKYPSEWPDQFYDRR